MMADDDDDEDDVGGTLSLRHKHRDLPGLLPVLLRVYFVSRLPY